MSRTRKAPITLLLLLLLCLISYLWVQGGMRSYNMAEATDELPKVPLLGEFLHSESRIIDIQASPNGEYLAVGGEGGLYLWDVGKRVCVWQDPSISPDIIRFSDDGKYLAVAKGVKWMRSHGVEESQKLQETVKNTAKNPVVYRLATRKALPLRLLPSKPENPQIILDMAFDGYKGNLHVVSGWGQYVPGMGGNGLQNITTSVISIPNGVQKEPRPIAHFQDWIPWQSVSYSRNASSLFRALIVSGDRNSDPQKRYLVVHDTKTGQEQMMEQHVKYDTGAAAEWKEWSRQFYFLAGEFNPSGRVGGDVFSALNPKTGITWDIYKRKWDKDVNVTQTAHNRFTRIAFAPDDDDGNARAALLGWGGKSVFGWGSDLYICIVQLSDGKVLEEIRRDYPSGTDAGLSPQSLAWVRNNLLVVGMDNTQMSWISIKNDEKMTSMGWFLRSPISVTLVAAVVMIITMLLLFGKGGEREALSRQTTEEDPLLPNAIHVEERETVITPQEALSPEEDKTAKGLAKTIFKLLWGYALAVMILRLTRGGYVPGYIDWTAFNAKGMNIAFSLLYYAVPFITLYWAYRSKLSQRCLLFIQGWGAVAAWNHIAFAFFLHHPLFFQIRVPIRSLLSSPACYLGLVMICLFFNAFRLFSRRRRCVEFQGWPVNDTLVALLLVLLLCFSPYLQVQGKMDARKVADQAAYARSQIPTLEGLLHADCRIKGIQRSPDGKYLALAGEEGLYLWDVDARTCVWQDPTISPDVLKFSRSGKYLAVAKSAKGVEDRTDRQFGQLLEKVAQNTAKPLAVYEVATRKPLPLHLLPRDPEKPQLILDIAFDAEEKNLHVASGWGNFDRSDASLISSWVGYANTSVIPLATGVQGQAHMINQGLRNWNAWISASYTADASRFFHLQVASTKSQERRNIVLYDTQNWHDRLIEQDKKYEISVTDGENFWRGWEEREGRLYFFAEEKKDGRFLGDLFSVTDLKDGATRDIYSRKREGNKQSLWVSMTLSPDGTKVALLRGDSGYDVYICVVRLDDGKVLQEIKRNYPLSESGYLYPWFLTWVRDDLLVLGTDNTQLAWIPLEKGSQ